MMIRLMAALTPAAIVVAIAHNGRWKDDEVVR